MATDFSAMRRHTTTTRANTETVKIQQKTATATN